MSPLLSTAVDYISGSPAALLITVGEGNIPFVRTIGPFVNDGLNVCFMTARNSEKVGHIAVNPMVTLYFQKEYREYKTFTSLAVMGRMSPVSNAREIEAFLDAISLKSPGFRTWLEKNDPDGGCVYTITADRIRYTDNSRKPNRMDETVG